MQNKTNSGAIRGYSPDVTMRPAQQQGAVIYERYATTEQITAKREPRQQYQQPQEYVPQPAKRQESAVAAFFKRRDVVVLISAVICTAWLLISYTIIGDMLNANQPGDTAEELGAALGTAIGAAMTIPFFILAFIGQVFNWVAWLTSRKGFILTAGILYCVSLLFGFSYGLGMIPCIVLAFIGYARLKKRQ